MNKRFFITIFAIMAAILLLAACQPTKEVSLNDQANGSEVTVKTDQILTIQLASNPTTGYGWEVDQCDEAVLKSQGDAEYLSSAPGNKRVGAGGVEVFHFKPAASGKTHLRLVYIRSWEKDVEPAGNYNLDVTVP